MLHWTSVVCIFTVRQITAAGLILSIIFEEWQSPKTIISYSVIGLSNFNVIVTRIRCNSNGYLIAVTFQTCQYEVTLVVLYGPNTDTPAFFNEVHKIIEDFNTPHFIVVGDWNVVLGIDMDSLNYLHTNNPKSRKVALKLMKNLDLYDVWRFFFHPITKRFT